MTNLLLFSVVAAAAAAFAVGEECAAYNLRTALQGDEDDYIFYGLTQDCQIFFARSFQLPLLAQLQTDTRSNYCFPNLVQLQLINNSSLRLLIKQPGNRMCVLEVNIPPVDILFGAHLFTYSIISSLPFAACSHSTGTISLEADLSFADSAYSDVIYFVEPTSTGHRWTTRQFLLDETNHMKMLEKMTIAQHSRDHGQRDLANEFVLALDTDKNFLFTRNRFQSEFKHECAFDLLFRPHLVVTHSGVSQGHQTLAEGRRWLNSMAVDGHVMVFAETDKQSPTAPTHLYVQRLVLPTDGVAASSPSHTATPPVCIARLPYRVEIGVVSGRTLRKMKLLPRFEEARHSPPKFSHRPHHAKTSTTKTTTTITQKTTTTTTKATTTTSTAPSTRRVLPVEETITEEPLVLGHGGVHRSSTMSNEVKEEEPVEEVDDDEEYEDEEEEEEQPKDVKEMGSAEMKLPEAANNQREEETTSSSSSTTTSTTTEEQKSAASLNTSTADKSKGGGSGAVFTRSSIIVALFTVIALQTGHLLLTI